MRLGSWVTAITVALTTSFTYLLYHCANIGVANDRGWLMSIGRVILPTWLFSASSVLAALWWIFMCDTKIFVLCAYSHRSLQMPLPRSSNLSPSCSLTNQPSHLPLPLSLCIVLLQAILFLHKVNYQMHHLDIHPEREFLLTSVFQGHPRLRL